MFKPLCFGLVLVALSYVPASAQSFRTDSGRECRVETRNVPTSYGSRPTPTKTTYCKDASGRWVISPGARPATSRQNGNSTVNYRGMLTSEWAPDTQAFSDNKTDLFTQIVQVDANEWAIYRFNARTVRNVNVFSRGGSEHMIVGDFQYGTLFGTSNGWAQILIKDGKFNCIRFWDERSCRALKDTPSSRLLQAMAESAEADRMQDPVYSARKNCKIGNEAACAQLRKIERGVPSTPWPTKYKSCMSARRNECLSVAEQRCYSQTDSSPGTYVYGATRDSCDKLKSDAGFFSNSKNLNMYSVCYDESKLHPYCAGNLTD